MYRDEILTILDREEAQYGTEGLGGPGRSLSKSKKSLVIPISVKCQRDNIVSVFSAEPCGGIYRTALNVNHSNNYCRRAGCWSSGLMKEL